MTSPVLSRRALALVAAALTSAGTAAANDYPTRPIELVVPSSPGGGTDIVARAFADVARRYSPQPFIVVNRPGASGASGMGEVLNARPDGYKVAMLIVELSVLQTLGQVRFGTDDFRLIARLNGDPASIIVPAGSPWRTIEDFVADVRARPGKINVGNSGVGSIWHLAAAAFEERIGGQILHVPYQGSAPGLLALISGHVDAMAVSPGEANAFVQDGKLRVLAVMSEQRIPGFENVPTLKERGIDLAVSNWRGIALPRATPQPVAEALSAIVAKGATDPAFQEALRRSNLGYRYAPTTQFEAAVKEERDFFRQITRNLQLN